MPPPKPPLWLAADMANAVSVAKTFASRDRRIVVMRRATSCARALHRLPQTPQTPRHSPSECPSRRRFRDTSLKHPHGQVRRLRPRAFSFEGATTTCTPSWSSVTSAATCAGGQTLHGSQHPRAIFDRLITSTGSCPSKKCAHDLSGRIHKMQRLRICCHSNSSNQP